MQQTRMNSDLPCSAAAHNPVSVVRIFRESTEFSELKYSGPSPRGHCSVTHRMCSSGHCALSLHDLIPWEGQQLWIVPPAVSLAYLALPTLWNSVHVTSRRLESRRVVIGKSVLEIEL